MSSRDVLTEGELDALMDSVSDDETLPDGGEFARACEPFDFSTREQTLLAQMPALHNLNEKHALALAEGIHDLYKLAVEVEAETVQMLRLDQALAGIADPSGINLVRISPLYGLSYVVMSAELLSFIVDRYFGGGKVAGASSARTSLTPSEQRINDLLLNKFLSTLAETWLGKVELTPDVASFESNPSFLQAGSPEELALVFSFMVKAGEWSSPIVWLVPYAALEPLRLKLGSPLPTGAQVQENSDWQDHFRSNLQGVTLEVSGSLTSEYLSIAEVLKFRTGSIVPLKMPTEVTLCVENQPFFYGEHGVLNGHKSIKIREMIHGKTRD